MRRRPFTVRCRGTAALRLLAGIALLAATGCAGLPGPDPREMRFEDISLEPPAHRRVVTANGTPIYLMEDHEVPLVNVTVLIRTGAVLDPERKTGLAEITGRLLRTGGTERYPALRLSETLERMGAVLETSIGREAGRASLSVLSTDLEKGVELLAQVLRYPVFADAEVVKEKRLKVEQIRRSNDDPDRIAFRELRRAIYGGDPRGRSATPEEIEALSRDELKDFHRSTFHPDRMLVGVSGDFEKGQFLEYWERSFGDWDPGGEMPPFPVPDEQPPPAVYLVDKGFSQTTIVLGQLAPPLESPDYYAFSLMNYILGGAGFNSRLTEEIRSNRGLSYSVGSSYRGDVGYGVLVAWCKTKPATAEEATRLILEVMEGMRSGGVTEEELRWAKEAIINGFIFAFDRTAEVVSRRISHEYDGLPADFLERYPERMRAVTSAEIARAARKYLQPRGSALVVVGETGDLGEAFSEFGPVREVKLREY